MKRTSLPSAHSATAMLTLAVLIGAGLTAVAPGTEPAAAADPVSAQTYLVSQTSSGTSDAPALSADGQHVAFVSTQALTAGDTNGLPDVYVSTAIPGSSDPFSGQAVLISRPGSSAGIANGTSSEPAISSDGRYVVFTSTATNLIPGTTTSGRRQVYLRDTVLDTTTMISAPGGAEPNGESYSADISADGRRIVFVSTAGDLDPAFADTDGQPDIFVADRDPAGDGSYGSTKITEATAHDAATQFQHPKISGNGSAIIYRDIREPDPGRPGDNLYIQQTDRLGNGGLANSFPGQTARFVRDAAIDYSGIIVAEVAANICDADTVIVIQLAAQSLATAVGSLGVDQRVGGITDVSISADGSTVAWSGTQPDLDLSTTPVALAQPVVRTAHPSYTDAWNDGGGVVCHGANAEESTTIGSGSQPSLSVGGRTVAYSGAGSGSATSVYATDTHSSNGLSVSTTEGTTLTPMYMTSYPTSAISAAAIHDYGSAFADAPIHKVPIHKVPIHKVPIHKVPIHKVPIHKVPIHKVPIHKVDLPGGWTQLLQGTPFEGQSDLVVTLGDVLDWADKTVADPNATAEAKAAAQRIEDLTLDDMDIDGSGIDALSLGALVLGSAPLSQVAIAGSGDVTARWQSVVDSQGVSLTVKPDTELAELDYAGVDVGRSGVDAVPLNSLPIAQTTLDSFPIVATDGDVGLELTGTIIGALPVSSLSDPSRIFAGPVTGTIGENLSHVKAGATAADLAAVVPASVTYGDFLATLLDSASYPWEQISPTSLDPAKATTISVTQCQNWGHCDRETWYSFSFDPGPGEATTFPQAVATITGPPGTRTSSARLGAGPTQADSGVPLAPTTSVGETSTYALGDVIAGATVKIDAIYQVTSTPIDGKTVGQITAGKLTATDEESFSWDLSNYSADDQDLLHEGTIYYGWLPPTYKELDDNGKIVLGPSAKVDDWSVAAPAAGQRLVVSTNATDGQVSISLYKPASGSTDLGVADLGDAPGTGTTEQSVTTKGAPADSGTDAGTPVAGSVLLDQSTVSGGGTADIEAASVNTTPGQRLTLHVTSGNGLPSSSLYSLRVQYIDEPAGPVCAAWTPAQTVDPGRVGTSDAVTDATNTIYVMDTKRLGDTWGATGEASVRAALESLDGTGVVPVHGAVISVDADPAVQSARTALDGDPCDMTARSALVKAINAAVSAQVGSHRSQITSVVMVGGDDILPLAPVAEHTDQFTEQSHAGDLRRATQPDGSACPPDVSDGAVDPCATPIEAAAATDHILSDDPYALATAYDTVGGTLYLPSVGIGRLVETPAQILAALGRFTATGGIMAADSTLTGGYGAWSDLPAAVTQNLSWRATKNTQLQTPWTKDDVASDLFPATGQSARVVSLNAHFDETALLPGILGAENDVFADSDLYSASSAASAANQQAIAGALIFTIGCHAADNLPTSYYGSLTDWVDVFQNAGGFVGNTGYGLASSTTSALGERLLDLYSQWIGVSSDGTPVSSAGALVEAKHAYLGQLGLYSGYDQKALMESVYYGLPMYTFANSTKSVPLPSIPADLSAVKTSGDLSAASLTLNPSFQQKTGAAGTYFTADGQDPAVVAGQPVLPKVTMQLNPAPQGEKARGALIRGLSSTFSSTLTPLIADTSAGVAAAPDATRSDVAFPSTFAHITTQQTPSGPVDLLVVTPAHVDAPVGGSGRLEKFTSMDLDVEYGDASSNDDTDPVITSTEIKGHPGSATLYATADGTGSAITAMLLLVQPQGSSDWQAISLSPPTDATGTWIADIPVAGPYRWMLQAVDAAGNVGIDTARGHVDVGGTQAPALGSAGADVTLATGARLTRSIEVTDATPGEPLTGTYAITDGGSAIASGTTVVAAGEDGRTRATIDAVVTTPGTYSVALTVCRGGKCATASFGLVVSVPDHVPTATATLTPATDTVAPDSVLTATGDGADADGDAVTLTYTWLRNGVPIAGQTSTHLDLHGIAIAGDTITSEVVPVARGVAGGAARTSVVVTAPIVVPPPTITAVATAGGKPYTPGTWSRLPVTVTFTCASSILIVECTPPVTVSADTVAAGQTVTGTVRDVAQQASVSILVKVDRTPPKLAPAVTPNPVVQGQPATAAANATDTASGVASQSCTPATTATPGTRTVTCQATDAAGNSTTIATPYLVTPAMCGGVADRTALTPINADSSSVFLRLSAIPIVFRACDASGKPIGTAGFVTGITRVSSTPLPASARVNEGIYLLPTIKPVYVKLAGTWVGSIGLASLSPGTRYTYRVGLSDGSWFTFTFGVR